MDNYPKVSIIVLNWNRPADTLDCLRSLFELDYPNYEVIVVDNGSTDDSVQRIRQMFPQATLIENAENIGFTGGNNQAMRHAFTRDAEYFWLVNNDATAEPETLKKLVETAEGREEVGLISPIVCFFEEPDKVQFRGIVLDFEDYSYRDVPLCPGSGEEIDKRDNLLVGTALLIKRRVVEDIGYFDERYFAYVEDFEYCMRAKRFGYLNVVEPAAKVYHKDIRWREKKRLPAVVFLRSRNTYFFWMDNIHGRKRKSRYLFHYLADRISFFAAMTKENRFDAAGASLDGAWAAVRGIGGPGNNRVKMPRVVKKMLSWHPYFWVGLLRGNIAGTLNTAAGRLREMGKDLGTGKKIDPR